MNNSLTTVAGAALLGLLAVTAPISARAQTPVAVAEDDSSYTLSNSIVTARVSKRSGDLISLQYRGVETLTDRSGHAGAYWSHDAAGGVETIARITIDPKRNGGQRAEVSVKGISGGKKMGRPAGSAADGDFPTDIEIRYSIGRGESGVYTYCIFEHGPEYPAGAIGEARFCAKLESFFDWISVDAKRNKYYPRELPGEDKYVYTALQSENLAYGWSSTTKNIGWWIVNPTIEYLSGGPTKPEFLCHRDTTPVQAPCALNYWRSSHYGGAVVSVAAGERWSKVVGPFLLYVNSGGDLLALWKDARAQAEKERGKWPYDWVAGVDYPRSGERSTVSGQLLLADPLLSGAKLSGKLMVGLAHAAHTLPPPSNRQINWQTDAKHYQFWAPGEKNSGRFRIPDVRPGTYTLTAFADGVLGEYVKAGVTIPAGGKPVDLGALRWTPVRRGRQLWDVGIPNRTAAEFRGGDRYFEPDTQLQYPKLFPDDVRYVIGKSDFGRDWYFEHVPHNEDPEARVVPFFGVRGAGRATPYRIAFDLPGAPRGNATLRLAICGTGAPAIEVSVNGEPVGQIGGLIGDGVITRHQVQGIWYERELAFDAARMKAGANVLTLTVPAGPVNNGIVYDYVRLELDESIRLTRRSPPPSPAPSMPRRRRPS